jgi:S-formylglutathione hydrolase FrmB
MSVRVLRLLLLAAVGLPFGSATAAPAPTPPGVPAGFHLVSRGPYGGTIWEGRIPDQFVADPRLADVYLPPGFAPDQQYPVLYLLHGFWGSPGSFVHGLHFATAADVQIANGHAEPFIAVMPPGGPMTKTTSDEWAGVWENYVVRDVVPWVDSHLPSDRERRAIAGLSAGGFGAVDIGLRHLGMFETLESWGGYFQPFRDGPFVHATIRQLDAHDPVLLADRDAGRARRDHLRVFLSTGRSGHGPVKAAWTLQFDRELTQLRIPHELWILPARKHDHLWRAQLPAAIDYAVPG